MSPAPTGGTLRPFLCHAPSFWLAIPTFFRYNTPITQRTGSSVVERLSYTQLVRSSNLFPCTRNNICAPRITPRGAFSFKGFGLRMRAHRGIVSVYIPGVQNAARECGVLAFSDTPQDENPSGLDFQWAWVHNRNTNQINALWQTRSRREVAGQATLGQKSDEQIASEHKSCFAMRTAENCVFTISYLTVIAFCLQ